MMDIALRGYLCSNDDAYILRFWGWRDITAPMDIAAALESAGGEGVTLLINSGGGSMIAGNEIASMLRRYAGETEALYQGMGASAATFAASGCAKILAEPGAVLCYHCPSMSAEGDWQVHRKAVEDLKSLREAAINVYMTRSGRTREEIGALLDADRIISPQEAMDYGLIDGVAGLPELEPMPLALTASMGGYPRVTAEMRRAYTEHTAAQAAAHSRAKRAMAKARALATY